MHQDLDQRQMLPNIGELSKVPVSHSSMLAGSSGGEVPPESP
jgi:hypothetical protein